jgi:4-hydroxy-tetrahydrodipicolinate synthase
MQIKGIYAPIVTPFDADEKINYPVFTQLIEFLIDNGISGLVPGGTTGEVYALSEAERLEIFQFVKDKAAGRVTLIAGTNSGATRDVIRYSQTAEPIGYDALMVAVPPYSRPTQRELLAHYRAVATSTSLPIILYNFPGAPGQKSATRFWTACATCPNGSGSKPPSRAMPRLFPTCQLSWPRRMVRPLAS